MVDQEALQRLWRFTEDDLSANRQGQLSDRQIEAQSSELVFMVKVGLISVAVVFSIVAIIVVIAGGFIVIPVLLVLAAFFVWIILRHKRRAGDFRMRSLEEKIDVRSADIASCPDITVHPSLRLSHL